MGFSAFSCIMDIALNMIQYAGEQNYSTSQFVIYGGVHFLLWWWVSNIECLRINGLWFTKKIDIIDSLEQAYNIPISCIWVTKLSDMLHRLDEVYKKQSTFFSFITLFFQSSLHSFKRFCISFRNSSHIVCLFVIIIFFYRLSFN